MQLYALAGHRSIVQDTTNCSQKKSANQANVSLRPEHFSMIDDKMT